MTMIEKAARALCEYNGDDPDATFALSEDHLENWRYCVGQVEAVLQAIREPSKAMIEAGCGGEKVPGDNLITAGHLHAKAVWAAMIDTALTE